MKVTCFRSLWGLSEAESLRDRFRLIKEAGFDGVEGVCFPEAEPGEWLELTEEFGLQFIAQVIAVEATELIGLYEKAMAYRPIRIVSHTGRDFFDRERGTKLFREVLEAEKDLGIPVAHETHRGRILFTPWTTAEYLREFPDLKLAADFSHWCCVAERLLDDQEEALRLASSRAIHIHGRIGHEEGPQVSDPRAPEFRSHLDRHLGWWDRIRAMRSEAGGPALTFTPEFGPPGYMQTLPYTRQPVTGLWEVNLWMADLIRERWSEQ
jgi:sugar phosphate isomerase/epimerase